MTPSAIVTLQQHLLSSLQSPPAEARRLFHGRGKCWAELEQITVDWLQDILLVTLFREPPGAALESLTSMLRSLGHPVLLQHRYQPDCPAQWLTGPAHRHWQISENGLHYRLDLGNRQNSGLFLDMRNGRQWVQQKAAGKSVLNMFAYTCGFSVAAIAGSARQVVNLDMASAALSRGRENHRLNRQDLSRVRFLAHDLFKSWGKVSRLGPYDLVIIDPPTFQKGSFVLTTDYRKILRRLPSLLTNGGQVLACCNDPEIGADFLLDEMADEAPQLRFVERLPNPEEFAEASEDGGLKALVFVNSSGAD